jgi:hypothetical protein
VVSRVVLLCESVQRHRVVDSACVNCCSAAHEQARRHLKLERYCLVLTQYCREVTAHTLTQYLLITVLNGALQHKCSAIDSRQLCTARHCTTVHTRATIVPQAALLHTETATTQYHMHHT